MSSSSAIEKIKTKNIYSIEGNIGAGKTTFINILRDNFPDMEIIEEPVEHWQNLSGNNLLEAFYTNPIRWGFSFEFYSMFSKTKALINKADSAKSIIITERSILSDKIFIEVSKELGKLDKAEYRMLINTYKFFSNYIYPKLTGIIYINTPVDECFDRIRKRDRVEEFSIEKSYLELINEKMNQLFYLENIPIFKIGGLYDPNKDEKQICKQIGEYLYKK